ncbi:hypothetical protein LZ30DRAFT_777447 [Colletotrichum cereale]|nr:hypothetical protein LZ30DRAFT_777447 [Colletotrichum cereale]
MSEPDSFTMTRGKPAEERYDVMIGLAMKAVAEAKQALVNPHHVDNSLSEYTPSASSRLTFDQARTRDLTIDDIQVSVTINNRPHKKSLRDSSTTLAKLFFRSIVENSHRNLRAILERAGVMNQRAMAQEFSLTNPQAPVPLQGLVVEAGVLIEADQDDEVQMVHLNLARYRLKQYYESLINEESNDRTIEIYFDKAFEDLGRQRTKGVGFHTVVKAVLADRVKASPKTVTGWFGDAALPYAVCQQWGVGAIMFMPTNKTNHRSALRFTSSLDETISIGENHDEGIFQRLADQLYSTVVSKIEREDKDKECYHSHAATPSTPSQKAGQHGHDDNDDAAAAAGLSIY